MQSMMTRLVVSLCLALLAVANPPLRTAVLGWIGAPQVAADAGKTEVSGVAQMDAKQPDVIGRL
jgi:hypothetical protein